MNWMRKGQDDRWIEVIDKDVEKGQIYCKDIFDLYVEFNTIMKVRMKMICFCINILCSFQNYHVLKECELFG